ncbi:unnamed protein product [Protopolystoma xenopodis]|uniref:Uncharacterized protein n=1 Tax=Protopolystoma xenopodis TaxID=117903 RepID=A0A3S5AES7_9PLAT|nr:unnamed protein product [Protopolystoma xenopodis]
MSYWYLPVMAFWIEPELCTLSLFSQPHPLSFAGSVGTSRYLGINRRMRGGVEDNFASSKGMKSRRVWPLV